MGAMVSAKLPVLPHFRAGQQQASNIGPNNVIVNIVEIKTPATRSGQYRDVGDKGVVGKDG